MNAIGHTLVEEMVYRDGQLLNPSLVDYRLPTFDDVPEEFHTVLVENHDGPGPYGVQGMGEGGSSCSSVGASSRPTMRQYWEMTLRP